MKFLDAVGETADVEGCFVRPDGLLYLKLEDDTVVPILASVGRREAEYIASEINAHPSIEHRFFLAKLADHMADRAPPLP